MQLFYHPDIHETDTEIVFPKDESRHIAKVLRKTAGDVLFTTNGKGFLFETKIISVSVNNCTAEILKVEKQAPTPYNLHLAVAPTKMNDRYEWFLEKATEIGIQEITPVFCDHSERKKIKIERFERVLQSAMKQSLHFYMPKLNEAVAFSDFVKNKSESARFIAHCEDEKQRQSFRKLLQPNQDVTVLIGPEGDFSSEEIENALNQGWQPISLGNSRLRTETAAIVACHTVALVNEK